MDAGDRREFLEPARGRASEERAERRALREVDGKQGIAEMDGGRPQEHVPVAAEGGNAGARRHIQRIENPLQIGDIEVSRGDPADGSAPVNDAPAQHDLGLSVERIGNEVADHEPVIARRHLATEEVAIADG
ncbi:MAG TPA: hypothetical protein VKV32_11960, partial [Stellaceae bacterium]|nr:hypothetical protein [Stellaceae bacterium]